MRDEGQEWKRRGYPTSQRSQMARRATANTADRHRRKCYAAWWHLRISFFAAFKRFSMFFVSTGSSFKPLIPFSQKAKQCVPFLLALENPAERHGGVSIVLHSLSDLCIVQSMETFQNTVKEWVYPSTLPFFNPQNACVSPSLEDTFPFPCMYTAYFTGFPAQSPRLKQKQI